jgi:hypothetical protein
VAAAAKISQKIIIIKLNYNNKKTRIKKNHLNTTQRRKRLMTTLLPSSPRSLPRKMRRGASSFSEPNATRKENEL